MMKKRIAYELPSGRSISASYSMLAPVGRRPFDRRALHPDPASGPQNQRSLRFDLDVGVAEMKVPLGIQHQGASLDHDPGLGIGEFEIFQTANDPILPDHETSIETGDHSASGRPLTLAERGFDRLIGTPGNRGTGRNLRGRDGWQFLADQPLARKLFAPGVGVEDQDLGAGGDRIGEGHPEGSDIRGIG